jgi:hypothetical protein
MNTTETSPRRIAKAFCAATAIIITGFLSPVIGAASAEETSPASSAPEAAQAGLKNGYYIQNFTGEELKLKSQSQGQEACARNWGGFGCSDSEYWTLGEGYGAEPPTSIPDQQKGYFEVPAYSYFNFTFDATEVVYETTSGKEVKFFAGVTYAWWSSLLTPFIGGIPTFQSDQSTATSMSDGLNAEITQKSEGKGTQTWLHVAKK